MNRTPQAILLKLKAQEKQRLSEQLACILTKQRRLMNSLDAATKCIERTDNECRRRMSEGAKAREIAALAQAQEGERRHWQKLAKELAELKETQRALIRKLYACDNEAKALDRMQKKHVRHVMRKRESGEQQRLDDLLAHYRGQRG